jgi:hypothetical protein
VPQHDRGERGEHHEEGVQDVVARDDAGAMARIATVLHECLQRHDEESPERADPDQVRDDAPRARRAQEGERPDWRRGRVDSVRGEEEVDPEDREADRAERDEPELDRPFRHPLAEEAPERDADREDSEEERHDALAPAEHLAREPGELREEERAVEPEPRDAED